MAVARPRSGINDSNAYRHHFQFVIGIRLVGGQFKIRNVLYKKKNYLILIKLDDIGTA